LLLSTENTPKTATDQTPIPIHEENHRIPKPNPNWTEPETNEDPHVTSKSGNNSSTSNLLRLNACKYARQVLETFLEMPSFLMDATPTCTCLCIGYCALVLAHYDASQSQIPDAVVLRLISRLDGWIQTSPGKAWSYKYCGLARQKVEARMSIATGYSNSDLAPADADRDAHDHDHGKGGSGDEQHQGVSTRRSAASHESRTNPQDPSDGRDHEYSMHDMLTSTDHAVDLNDGLPPSFDLGEQALFPSMEGFFGGGFLDFMR
jgi:hypothetical protein